MSEWAYNSQCKNNVPIVSIGGFYLEYYTNAFCTRLHSTQTPTLVL